MTDILHTILANALPIIGTAVGSMIVAALATWMKRHGIEMTAAQHDFAMKIVNEGIALAEEKVANGAAASTAKHDLALDYAQANLPGLSRAQASDMIHAALPASGAGATAAAFDPTKSAQPK